MRLLAIAVAAAAVLVPAAPASAHCLPQCLVAQLRCRVDVGRCEGSCIVNVGYCAPGGRCAVNVGYCDDSTLLPVGT